MALDPAVPGDRKMLERAVGNRWPVPAARRPLYIAAVDAAIVNANGRSDYKAVGALVAVIVKMDGLNQADEHLHARLEAAKDFPALPPPPPAPAPEPAAPVLHQTNVTIEHVTLERQALTNPEIFEALVALRDRLEAGAPKPGG